jgi:predicted GIY-YIG superfamily endonuclease
LQVLAVRRCRDKGRALRVEHAVKRLSRVEKLALAATPRKLSAIGKLRLGKPGAPLR